MGHREKTQDPMDGLDPHRENPENMKLRDCEFKQDGNRVNK